MVDGNTPGESNALMVRAPAIVFFVLTPIFVAIRFWSRIKMRSGLGWDDWTILFSFVSLLWACATVHRLTDLSDLLPASFDPDDDILRIWFRPAHLQPVEAE